MSKMKKPNVRKDWGDVDPREKVHTPKKDKNFERHNLRRELEDQVHRYTAGLPDDEDDGFVGIPFRLIGGKRHTAMKHLKAEKGYSIIPKGDYCYDQNGNCPYWDKVPGKSDMEDGFCWFLERGDWENGGLLWDQCKECPHNIGEDCMVTEET